MPSFRRSIRLGFFVEFLFAANDDRGFAPMRKTPLTLLVFGKLFVGIF